MYTAKNEIVRMRSFIHFILFSTKKFHANSKQMMQKTNKNLEWANEKLKSKSKTTIDEMQKRVNKREKTQKWENILKAI